MEAIIAVLVMLVMLTVCGAGLYFGLQSYTRAMLGDIDLSTSARRACMDETIHYELNLTPTGKLSVDSMVLHCMAYEWIRWTESETYTDSDGKTRTRTATRTQSHTVHDMQQVLMQADELQGDQAFHRAGEFHIPEDGPASMSAGDNAIRWCLRLDIVLDGLPDVSQTYDFTVRPVVLMEG